MILSSQYPIFFGDIGHWKKISECDTYIVLTGGSTTEYLDCHRFNIRGIERTLSLLKASREKTYAHLEFIPDSLKKITKSLKQELCCNRFGFHKRLHPLVERLEAFTGNNFLDLVVMTNEMISRAINVNTDFMYDTVTDPLTSRTKALFLAGDRHCQQPYEYLVESSYLVNSSEVPQGCSVYSKNYGVRTSGECILQHIAKVEFPLTGFLENKPTVCR